MSTTCSAPGKAILLGEHAVVYGRPAIAVPVGAVRATATICATNIPGVTIRALDTGDTYRCGQAGMDDTGQALCAIVAGMKSLDILPDDAALDIAVTSTVPMARGMGSGAALATAVTRALDAHLSLALPPEQVSQIVYESERVFHGTPSGVDNTVIAYEQPVFYVKGRAPETFSVGAPLTLLIADSGIPSRTRDTVAAVRTRWQASPAEIEHVFDTIGDCVRQARTAISAGDPAALGVFMDQNQQCLRELGVSCPEIDALAAAAVDAGALGAKLSGGGGGGCMIALVTQQTQAAVEASLWRAGAASVIGTHVG